MRTDVPRNGAARTPRVGVTDAIGGMIFVALGLLVSGFGLWNSAALSLVDLLVGLLISLPFVGAGLVHLFGKAHHRNAGSVFVPASDEACRAITPSEIHSGESVHFTFRRTMCEDAQIDSIRLFLIYRETVTYPVAGDRQTTDVDRLFETCVVPGSLLHAGNTVTAEASFQIPVGDPGIRNPFMKRSCDWQSFVTYGPAKVKTSWQVRVRLRFANGQDFWQTFHLDIVPGIEERENTEELAGRYDLFLGPDNTKSDLTQLPFITEAMLMVLPHIGSHQVSELFLARPCLLLERLTWGQAEEAKALLEMAGARVVVTPAHLMPDIPTPEAG